MLSGLARLVRLLRPRTGRPGQPPARPRTRLAVEALEERALLNNRFVVPPAVAADNVTHFHTLRSAVVTPGLVGGDVVQIQLGSSPGLILGIDLDHGLQNTGGNLTIQGEP